MSNEDLERNMDAASRKVAKCLSLSSGGGAAENEYASAYQKLVQAGLRPQIKGKYRGR